MKKIILFIIFNLIFCSYAAAQYSSAIRKVQEIKILESSRNDVRKILADYQLKTHKDEDEFYKDGLTIEVSYSTGKCGEDDYFNLDVVQGKVIDVGISSKKQIKLKKAQSELKKLGINISQFVKERRFHNDDSDYVYHNKKLGISLYVSYNELDIVVFMPQQKYYSLMCNKEFAKILSSTESIFDIPFEERWKDRGMPQFANVTKLILSKKEIVESCSQSELPQNKSCSVKPQIITVSTSATSPNKDPLEYIYKVTGGKIIGTGRKVLWDLSGVKAGTYEVMAGVDDGCGLCGNIQRKTVIVKECSDCKPK